jgi:hypothetical protein
MKMKILMVVFFFFQEYITVLVCNGKNQEQARHDLEAFLGQRTQEFVSW